MEAGGYPFQRSAVWAVLVLGANFGWLVVGLVVGCFLRETAEGRGYRSVSDHLPNMHEALGSTPGTEKKNEGDSLRREQKLQKQFWEEPQTQN